MGNIILEGLDFTGKSSSAKVLSKSLGLKLVNKQVLLQVFGEDYLNIKDANYILQALNQEDGAVFDRHFMSLLVYWKLTKSGLYKKYIDELKVIRDFIQSNPGSVLSFRYVDYKFIVNTVTRHKKNPKKSGNLTEHDLNLLDL